MISESYRIAGGDFERAGSASGSLKERLKKIGVEAKDMRRVMIAAYEAEMNVVIHARRGIMRITLNNGQINIEVTDEGPGIGDIERAMKIGYSTASQAAKEMGFGAGMGLPNIRKNSDLFEIDSSVGSGTSVRSTIYLKLQDIRGSLMNSLHVTGELCNECLHCLHACPTKAIRVRDGRPQILQHLCIDCTACIAVCKTGALGVETSDIILKPSEDTILLLPAAFLAQFGVGTSPKRVLAALSELGFNSVRIMEWWEDALQEAVIKYAEAESKVNPVISPICPAVVNFIEMRFPSLIGNLAPFLSPVQAALNEFECKAKAQDAVFVISCPGQHTALILDDPSGNAVIVTPSSLFNAVMPFIESDRAQNDEAHKTARKTSLKPRDSRDVLRISGIHHVRNVLEKAENGLLNDFHVLELFMCDQGCFGSPLMVEDPFIAHSRLMHSHLEYYGSAEAVRRKNAFTARAGLRLDADMSKSIMKLKDIDELTKSLPGKDCGLCGSPTCSSLAEDIVMDRAEKTDCIYLAGNGDKEK
jgi:anti-sigma regulatory factor (Ser/Thr protein kinase)/Na+-translocating ferredoxin:NAD+ oxidoreductase RNF subunit RnfB